MSHTQEDLRANRQAETGKMRRKYLGLESTLIPGLQDNGAFLEVLGRLRGMTVPKGAGRHRRQIREQMHGSLKLRFYSRSVTDFVFDRGVNPRNACTTARCFNFEGPVTVTREMNAGRFYYVVEDGTRTLSVCEEGTKRTGYRHKVMRADGFAERSGRKAGRRFGGRGPRAESE